VASAPGPRFALPPSKRIRTEGRSFLNRWPGRLLIAAASISALDKLGVRLFDPLPQLANATLVCFAIYALFRLGRYLARGLLWRIRTKLIVSYLFIAVVPLVLVVIFFVLAGFLGLSMVASYTVSAEIDRTARELGTFARAAVLDLRPGRPDMMDGLTARLAPARALHPKLGYTLVEHGTALAHEGGAPVSLPSWLKGDFAGLVRDGETDVLRAVAREGDAFLVLEVPFDEALWAGLKAKTGIGVIPTPARARVSREGGEVELTPAEERRVERRFEALDGGAVFFSVADRTDWRTGSSDLKPMGIRYSPAALVRRLSPGSLDIGDALVKGMALVAAAFLIVYSVALMLGLVLARSITKSIHELTRGTERLRGGDFAHPIPIQSRDQLGELAESFNVMASGIQDLLRSQAEKERLEEELRIARQIQMSLLPRNEVTLAGMRVAALCLPAAEVGGDYYDLLPLSDTRMGVLVADVSGKGTSAALYMAELKGLILSLSRVYESPARLLAEANRILASTMDPRSFITMTYAVVDTAARVMRYARAGHSPMMRYEAATGRTHVLAPPGLGLGLDPGERFEEVLREAEVPLVSGDLFLFFTDGLSEAMNTRSELFGEQRLRAILEADGAGRDEEAVKERILTAVRDFVGEAAQHDDLTFVILRVV
jgi:sigma-B regulation protein RsbU (phosphoserine phosphatase)